MDSVLIKTNFSKKKAAFSIRLYPWRHPECAERSGAAPQLPLIATAVWAVAKGYQQHIHPMLRLTQLWYKTWIHSCFLFEGFLKGSEQTIKMYDGWSLLGTPKRPRKVCSRKSFGVSRACFGRVPLLWDPHLCSPQETEPTPSNCQSFEPALS